jgi:Tfp pilus assembly protein PilV
MLQIRQVIMRGQTEKGFATIEIIIVIVILGLIMPGMAMTISTIMTNHQQAKDYNIVFQQVQNADYWISRDIQTAKDVLPAEPDGFPLTLVIPVDVYESHNRSIDYAFADDKLQRLVYDSSHSLTAETTVADYVDVPDTVFHALESGNYSLTIKACKGKAAAERSYQIARRLGPL